VPAFSEEAVAYLLQYVDVRMLWPYRGLLLEGLWITLSLTVLTFLIAAGPGLLFAFARRFGPRWLDRVLGAVVNFCRSVPTVLSVVFIYIALPFAGLTFSTFVSVLISLTIMQVAYFTEVFRGALTSVNKGQFEAAYACGLRTSVVLRKVILPQAARIAAPAFANSLVLLVHNTSIASAIALHDVLGAALTVQTISGAPVALIAAAVGYLMIVLPLVRWSRNWERRMARAN
jgi:polar amino acid transport system permease protein